MPDREHAPGRDWVALTIAIGVCTAFNLVTIGVLLAAFYRGSKSGDYGLSENATQVLIAGFGGFVGILGGYVGGRAVERASTAASSAERDRITAGLDALAEVEGNGGDIHTEVAPRPPPTPLGDTPDVG